MTMTAEQIAIVESFAKANKVSKAKAMEMVSNLIAQMPQKQVPSGMGRKVSDNSLQLRERMKAFAQEHKGKTFISPEVAKLMGAEIVDVNNTIRFLAKTENLFKATGTMNNTGKRGKPPVIWSAM